MSATNSVNINSASIIRITKVVQIEDNLRTDSQYEIHKNSFGRRIKVRLAEHGDTINDDDCAWAWPLLPKHLQITPKVGEMVLVFLPTLDSIQGNLFYIGPIISQDYYLNHGGEASALSLLQGKGTKPLCHPEGNPLNDGSYPSPTTIAIQGRGDAAMWLKDEELRLMCGHKPNWEAEPIKEQADPGSLTFNRTNLSYIQMKYGQYRENDERFFDSVINVVADRIHLITHDGAAAISGLNVTDNEELMTQENIEKFSAKGQKMVYGDELVAFLNQFRRIFREHTHHWSNDPQVTITKDNDFWNKDLNELLCKTIRIA